MTYHLTPAEIAIIKKSRDNKCWSECEEKGTPVHVAENVICVATAENSAAVPQEKMLLLWPRKYTTEYIPKEELNVGSQKDTYTPVSSIIHNSKLWKQPK